MIKVKKRRILLLPGDGIGPEVIALSLEKSSHINEFEKKIKSSKPWIFND